MAHVLVYDPKQRPNDSVNGREGHVLAVHDHVHDHSCPKIEFRNYYTSIGTEGIFILEIVARDQFGANIAV